MIHRQRNSRPEHRTEQHRGAVLGGGSRSVAADARECLTGSVRTVGVEHRGENHRVVRNRETVAGCVPRPHCWRGGYRFSIFCGSHPEVVRAVHDDAVLRADVLAVALEEVRLAHRARRAARVLGHAGGCGRERFRRIHRSGHQGGPGAKPDRPNPPTASNTSVVYLAAHRREQGEGVSGDGPPATGLTPI